MRAGSGGSGGLHAYQTTPARYAIGTFMTTIRKMNPHHSPDTAKSVVPEQPLGNPPIEKG
jgi:hypothetical protein